MSCKVLTKILIQQYFPQNNNDTMQVGKKLLDFLLFKVCLLDNKDKKLYDMFNKNILDTIISYLDFSDNQHLAMCFGNIAIKGQYENIKQVQLQLSEILKTKSKLAYQPTNLQSNSLTLNKTFDNSHQTSYNGMQASFARKNNSINYGSSWSINSKIKKVQETNNNDQVLKQLSQQFKNLQMKKTNQNEMSISFQSSNKDKSHYLKPKSQKSFFQQDFDNQDVEVYLKGVNANTQLNHAVQILKLKKQDWQQSKSGNYSVQSCVITVPSIVTRGKPAIIQGVGQASNKKDARTQASIDILRKLYGKFQHILRQMKQIKSQRAL